MKLSEVRRITEEMTRIAPAERENALQKLLCSLGVDPENLYQELEMESKLVDTHQDTSFSNNHVSLHSHTFFEILCCRNTCGAEYLVGSDRYRLQKGDIIFISPGVSHRPLLPESMAVPYKRDIIWFSQELVGQFSQMLPDSRLAQPHPEVVFLRTKGTKWDFLGEMFRSGVKEAERGKPESDGIVLGNTIMILSQIARALEETSTVQLKAEKPELLDKVMAYIEANLAKRITLEETARHFYISVSTVTQLFRQKMGTSFYRCVTQRRLLAARNMIQEGAALEEVSIKTGFSDYATFYRAFKKEFGISPRQYRNL